MQESPGAKPDWLNDSKSFSLKNLYSSLNMSLSKIEKKAFQSLSVVFDALIINFLSGSEPHYFFPFHKKFYLTKA